MDRLLIALQFALRNVLRQRGRTAVTLASIMLGVVALIISGGFVEDVFIQLREATIHSRLGHMQVYRDGFVSNGTKEPYRYIIGNPADVQKQVSASVGVLDSMKRLNFFGLVNNGRTDLAIVGEGVEPGKEAKLASFMFVIAGRQIEARDRYGILLGEGVAKSLGTKVGAVVTLLANTAEGALNSVEFEVIGIFRTYAKDFDARAVRIALPAAQELLGVEGAHAIVVSLIDAGLTDDVARQVRARLTSEGYEVRTWFELDDFYAKTVDLYRSQLGVLQFIVLIVVLLSVANSVNMTMFERIGEFGTLRALGRRDSQVSSLIIIESALLGTAGACLGVVAGVLIALLVSQIGIPMPPPPNSNAGYTAYIRIVPSVLAHAAAIAILATVLSALIPARSAARVAIVDALRHNV